MLYILIAILMFGALIAVHEFGHFICAKLLGVRVNEFAIGMGPKLLSKERGETTYTLRLFPIGGFCAMEGEEEDTGDPKSFQNKPAWKKFIILVAGSFMNFMAGLLIFLLLFSQTTAFRTTEIGGFLEGFPLEGEQGLMVGDRIVEVDGHAIYLAEDIDLFFDRAGDTMDLVVVRDGQKITLNDFPMKLQEYESNGEKLLLRGITRTLKEATVLDRIQLSLLNAVDTVRLVWISLGDLISGAVGVKDMSGPIGIIDMIGEVGQQAETTMAAVRGILYFVAFIAINLAVMNLLPIPALDGGRIFFLAVNGLFTFFTRKKLNPKYESYINIVGFLLLIGLMVVVAFSDVRKLIG